jgi:hypothetical protein
MPEGEYMRSLSAIVNELEAKRDLAQREVRRFNDAIAALRGATAEGGDKPTRGSTSKPRRTMSLAARKRIAAAQKARWAAWKARQKKAS